MSGAEDGRRGGSLDRQQAGGQRAVVEDRPRAVEPLGQRVRHDRGVARVGDDEEARLAEPVDDEVVDDPAVVGADHRIVGAPDREARRVA